MDFELIAKFRKDIAIKKHVSGKIVLGFKASLMLNPELTKLLKEAPKKPACIQKTSLNIFTRTLSIEYDENVISKELLEQIFHETDDAIAAKSLKLLHERVYSAQAIVCEL